MGDLKFEFFGKKNDLFQAVIKCIEQLILA